MEANVCDVNHLDSDVLLPPRKRLLACLKKQNGDANGSSYSPSTSSSTNEFDTRINHLLRAHLSNDHPSQEEMVEAARSAAEAAIKVAITARAAAEKKAVVAAKAMAAAKKALELVATVDEQEISSSTEPESKMNKTKRRVPVQMLYNSKKPRLENDKTDDEELARKLHQAINSSPRISKCGSGAVLPSNIQGHKPKKLKSFSISENGINTVGKEVENTIKSKMENRNAEDTGVLGRKRGRIKQKKLPLSICSDRDQGNPKEDQTSRPLFSVGPSANSGMPIERSSSWKCQSFKAPACVKQNKVMQL